MAKAKAVCAMCTIVFWWYPSSGRKGKYCSTRCHQRDKHIQYITRWKQGSETGGTYAKVSAHVRRYLHEKQKDRCSQCDWGEVNPHTGKVPLQIDHIDGDWSNNAESNVRLICPNCHSLTPTYVGANKGSASPRPLSRQYRRKSTGV